MSMSAYIIIESLLKNPDLENFGNILIDFANKVYKEKNRTTIVKQFYEQLFSWSINKLHFYNFFFVYKRNYLICDESRAAMYYLNLFIPEITSTVKTINEIKIYGESLLSRFIKPVGKCISVNSLENIMQFLDKEYNFSSKVFTKAEAVFLILHNTNKNYNSECLCLNDDKFNRNLFFLYHMKKKKSISPEAVLFHELGHALHTQYSGDVKNVPDNIIDILQDLCFPKIKQSSKEEQSELFADVLSVGLMYQTPYEKMDRYNEIHHSDKKAFKIIVEKIIETL
jgi:hypothetical protein